jgi:hypothetical protein
MNGAHASVEEHTFFASTTMLVGNGLSAKFWEDSWIDGHSTSEIAPSVLTSVYPMATEPCLFQSPLAFSISTIPIYHIPLSYIYKRCSLCTLTINIVDLTPVKEQTEKISWHLDLVQPLSVQDHSRFQFVQ